MPTCDDLTSHLRLTSHLPWCDNTVEQHGFTSMLVLLINAKFVELHASFAAQSDQIQVTTCLHPECWSVAVQAINR